MSAPRRVLLVEPTSAMGGAERALLSFARRLHGRGFAIELAAPDGGELAHGFRGAGVAVHAFDPRGIRLTRPVALARSVARARALEREHAPDMVLLNGLRALKTCLALRASGGPPVVAFVHDVLGPASRSRALEAFGYFRDRIARWIVPCAAAGSALVEGARVDAARVTVVAPACEPVDPLDEAERGALRAAVGVPRDVPLVGFVGQLEARKGVDLYLDALCRLPRVDALLVGDDPFGEHRAYRDAMLELGRRVPGLRVLGWRHDAARLAAALDVLVCPSRDDACPLVVLEAMAAGVPVVASRVGGLPEQLGDEEAGLLVPPGDAPALAGALSRLIEDPELRARLGSAGRRRFEERFAPELASERLAEVLREPV